MNDQSLLSKRESARLLGISLRTLDTLIAAKEIAIRRVGRRVLVPRRAAEEFARRDHAMPTRKEGRITHV